MLISLSVLLQGCKYLLSEKEISLDNDTIRSAITKSANYLVKTVKEDGTFEYRINMDPSVKVGKSYNILRHAGTIYAMAMFYQLRPDDNMRSAIERAGKYFRDEVVGPVPGKSNMSAAWSNPGDSPGGKPFQAKLGGTGLGLASLLSIEKISPGFTPIDDLRKLGRFIIYMQEKDGSFYSKYIPSKGGYQGDWKSLYYPGEAALGLAMLYEKDPAKEWINSSAKALEYLALSRRGKRKVPADHWALLATEKLLFFDDKELPVSRDLLINHAIQICESILREQIKYSVKSKYVGGFARDGRTTPASTRLEGLIAALSFLPQDQTEIRKRIEPAVDNGMKFLLKAQVSEGEFAGAIPMAVGKKPPVGSSAKEFNDRVTEVRIDYVQHALSAMIQYMYLLRSTHDT